jgi:hypothetical protein
VYSFAGLYGQRPGVNRNHTRGKIKSFSVRSRRRCRLVLRNIIDVFQCEVTLTYPEEFPIDGRVCQRHYKNFLQRLRRRGIKYFQIKEFQERGAPHLHILVSRFIDKGWIAKAWFDIVGSGDEKHLRSGTRIDWLRSKKRTASYFTEYMKKLQQKQVPEFFQNVGRFWGYTRGLVKMRIESFHGDYLFLARLFRTERKLYQSKCRSWGFNWKWNGRGYVHWDHSPPVPTEAELHAKIYSLYRQGKL